MGPNFSQMITARCRDRAQVIELIRAWDVAQAKTDVMGYMGTRILVDREDPDRLVFIADFGVVDPNVSAAEEAERNNARPETQAIAAALAALADGDPEYHNYDEIYRTDPIELLSNET